MTIATGTRAAYVFPGENGRKTMEWTEDLIEIVRKLKAEGRSSSQIADVIGCSRNAVIGQCTRRGIPTLRKSGDNARERRRKPYKLPAPAPTYFNFSSPLGHFITRPADPAVKPEPVPPVEPDTAPAGGVALLDLTPHQCRWPIGPLMKPSDRFCGAQKDGESSYCRKHHARACVPLRRKLV